MDKDNGRPKAPATTTHIMTWPGLRAYYLRRRVSRHLDDLLGSCRDPWSYSEPAYDQLAMDWPEREAAGRELAEKRWKP